MDKYKRALIVIDAQNDFMPGGSLAVSRGNEIVPVINELAKRFSNVIITEDWHPAGHISFASSHAGKNPFEVITLPYGDQVLWPDHCVQGTGGAELHSELIIPHAQLIIRKGYHPGSDSYSAFKEADGTRTGLAAFLHERRVVNVFLCGLATDFCVAWSAVDAVDLGFGVTVVEDACRAIDMNGSLEKAWEDMKKRGVARVSTATIDTSGGF